jgi:hypothetical protein
VKLQQHLETLINQYETEASEDSRKLLIKLYLQKSDKQRVVVLKYRINIQSYSRMSFFEILRALSLHSLLPDNVYPTHKMYSGLFQVLPVFVLLRVLNSGPYGLSLSFLRHCVSYTCGLFGTKRAFLIHPNL